MTTLIDQLKHVFETLSIAEIQKKTGIPEQTIRNYAKERTPIENIPVKNAIKILSLLDADKTEALGPTHILMTEPMVLNMEVNEDRQRHLLEHAISKVIQRHGAVNHYPNIYPAAFVEEAIVLTKVKPFLEILELNGLPRENAFDELTRLKLIILTTDVTAPKDKFKEASLIHRDPLRYNLETRPLNDFETIGKTMLNYVCDPWRLPLRLLFDTIVTSEPVTPCWRDIYYDTLDRLNDDNFKAFWFENKNLKYLAFNGMYKRSSTKSFASTLDPRIIDRFIDFLTEKAGDLTPYK